MTYKELCFAIKRNCESIDNHKQAIRELENGNKAIFKELMINRSKELEEEYAEGLIMAYRPEGVSENEQPIQS